MGYKDINRAAAVKARRERSRRARKQKRIADQLEKMQSHIQNCDSCTEDTDPATVAECGGFLQ